MAIKGVGSMSPALHRQAASGPSNQPGEATFADLLRNVNGGLKVSNHALKRFERRELPLDAEKSARLDSAISRAAEKGSRNSVVVLDDLAVVVDVRERTVVTAMQRDPTRERVFTNIDSVVIA